MLDLVETTEGTQSIAVCDARNSRNEERVDFFIASTSQNAVFGFLARGDYDYGYKP